MNAIRQTTVTSPVEYSAKRLLIDGRPAIILAGEVHYFRLRRDEWKDRIQKLADSGCTAVASYIPWLFHELPDGTIDVSGTTIPERDVGAFIDLCAQHGLHFIARPGPFVMAELKNEGLPFRLYEEHPEICPVTWDDRSASSRTVDYLAPAFLAETRRWYAAIMPVLATRLQPGGGNVIAVQLDNEVGMLSWVTNEPDLTDLVLDDFGPWLHRRYDEPTFDARYPRGLSSPAAVRSPGDDYAPALHQDLGYYMRDRFRRYIATLRDYADENGVTAVPYIVNIHGTSDGHARTFPIGISQLADSYSGVSGLLSGTDIYLGDLTLGNAADLYLVNAFTDAVNDDDQPLTSMEFEAGNANYGDDLTTSVDPAASDLKTRLCLAQGNRLLNYYLFAGGINPRLDSPVGDGNDRIAFTGERHGFAAPVSPEGLLTPAYHRTTRTAHAVHAVADRLAGMREERDDIAIGLVLDHYLTEYCHPESDSGRRIIADLEVNRGGGPRQVLARALLLGGYRFGAIDLQRWQPDGAGVLALASTRHLDPLLQRQLVEHLHNGGRLLLYGPLPGYDMLGAPCTTLVDSLRLAPRADRHGSPRFYPSVCAAGWAAPRPEVRVNTMQLFDSPESPLLYDYDSGLGCGFDISVGAGRAIAITADYPCDIELFHRALELLGTRPRLTNDCAVPGLIVTSTANDAGEHLLHVLNLTGSDDSVHFAENGVPLFDGNPVTLANRTGAMLPIDWQLSGARLAWATCELASITDSACTVRPTAGPAVIAIETAGQLHIDPPCPISREGSRHLVHVPAGTEPITIRWT